MGKPSLILSVLLGCLAVEAGTYGQAVDEEESETLRASSASAQAATANVQKAARLIVEKTNQFRQQHGLRKVETNPNLSEAARYFANFMAKNNKYGHTADGLRPAGRAREHGYQYCIVTENIAYQYNSAGFATQELAEKFVNGWKESPGHRENMLDPDVTETGLAVARSEETGHYYAVQMFGRPKSNRIEFEVANQSGAMIRYEIGERQFSLPPRYTRTHERCRPAKLSFHLPDGGEGKTKTVTPDSGDQFVLQSEEGQVQLKTQ